MAVDMPMMPLQISELLPGPYETYFAIKCSASGKESAEFAWQVKTQSGFISGKTKSGKTAVISSQNEELIELDYIFQTRVGIR